MIILFITIFSQNSTAYNLESVQIKDSLTETGKLLEEMTLIMTNNTNDILNLHLPKDAYNIKISGKETKTENNTLNLKTACVDCKITLSYELKNIVKNIGADTDIFSRTMYLPKQPANLIYSIKIPIGKKINLNDNTNIIPKNSHISTDGEGIIVNWEEQNPDLPKIYQVKYSGHENSEEIIPEYVNELKETSVLIIILIALILGLIAGWHGQIIHTNRKKQITKKTEITEIPSSLFNPDEKIIINKIKENNNQIKQKELGKQLNWSKSKVSAIITNLEYKKIIRREKIGRNYDIFLEKDMSE